jgi:hypothetical protein
MERLLTTLSHRLRRGTIRFWPGRCFVPGWRMVVLLIVVFCLQVLAQSPYQLKAAVLGNLAKFVEWPASAFSSASEAIRIGVLGEDPFGSDLETILRPISVKGRSFTVIRAHNIDELLACHIVFIQPAEPGEVRETIKKVGRRPILLIGESAEFLDLGGMVRFHLEDRKVRFEINLAAADSASLSLHPQVLKLATTVKRKEKAQ